jgi:hypothetical protein
MADQQVVSQVIAQVESQSAPIDYQTVSQVVLQVETNPNEISYSVTSAGGCVTGGSSSVLRGKVFPSTNGSIVGGASVVSYQHTYSVVSSDGLVVGGASAISMGAGYNMVSSGGLVTAGVTSLVRGQVVPSFGGAVTGGSSPQVQGRVEVSSSGGVVGGGAAITGFHNYSVSSLGGLVAGGASEFDFGLSYPIRSSGGAVFGGSSAVGYDGSIVSAGGSVAGGSSGILLLPIRVIRKLRMHPQLNVPKIQGRVKQASVHGEVQAASAAIRFGALRQVGVIGGLSIEFHLRSRREI